MAERWVINADSATPLVLPLVRQRGAVHVTSHETPSPAPRTAFAQRPEGALPASREHELRDVKITVALAPVRDQWAGAPHTFAGGAPEAEGHGAPPGWTGNTRRTSMEREEVAALEDLQRALGAMRTSGQSIAGTLIRVLADGRAATLDVVEVLDDGIRWDRSWYAGRWTEITMTFRCLPYWRSEERLIGSAVRAAGKRMVSISGQVPGDVDADARIELSGATANQSSVLYAIDQGSSPVEFACSAIDRPPSATLTTVAGSVATQVVQRPAFTAAVGNGLWETGVLLSQSGAPLAVPGRWRVMARVRGQSGAQVRLRWTSGSRVAGMTVGYPVTLRSSQWELITLGQVAVPDGAGLDGVIETALPHSQPIQYDQLLLVPELQGEQHATRSAPPAELLAADQFLGATTGLANSVAEVGGQWGNVGFDSAFARSGGSAYRSSYASSTGGRSHGLALGSPAGARTSAILSSNVSNASAGMLGIWVANAAGEAALTGVSGITGNPGSGSTGAWGALLAIRVAGPSRVQWGLTVVNGTSVETTLSTSYWTSDPATVQLTVGGGRAFAEVYPGWAPPWGSELAIPSTPAAIRTGVVSSGWTVNGSGAQVSVQHFVTWAAAGDRDAALYAARSARHTSTGASRVDGAGIRGPVVPSGARPRLPAAGPAGTPTRVSVMTTRGLLPEQVDAAPSDPLSVQVYATPRWLQIPGDPS